MKKNMLVKICEGFSRIDFFSKNARLTHFFVSHVTLFLNPIP